MMKDGCGWIASEKAQPAGIGGRVDQEDVQRPSNLQGWDHTLAEARVAVSS
jgi:hypothetical protein